jgi:hypothetical protein
MELNRSAARPPSLSRTSSASHRLPSLIQCQNQQGLKIHLRRPPPLPSTAFPTYKRHPWHCSTPPHLIPLSAPPLCASTSPTPSTTTTIRSSLSPALPHRRAGRQRSRWGSPLAPLCVEAILMSPRGQRCPGAWAPMSTLAGVRLSPRWTREPPLNDRFMNLWAWSTSFSIQKLFRFLVI